MDHRQNRNQKRAGPNRPLSVVLRFPFREVTYETVRKGWQEGIDMPNTEAALYIKTCRVSAV